MIYKLLKTMVPLEVSLIIEIRASIGKKKKMRKRNLKKFCSMTKLRVKNKLGIRRSI
jgi:hypothetical protein